jgi:MFS transporter, UMF1 family
VTAQPLDPAQVPDADRVREQRGWFFYDWAASAFSTTVVTVFLGPYLTSVTEDAADANGFVQVLGVGIRDSAFFPAMITVSVLLQVILLPIVGAVADRASSKRRLLALFAGIGSVATMAMYFVRDGRFELGGLLLVTANVAFGASIVVYNAFLPEISTADERDQVSARGWALGYFGGFILLLLNLILFTLHDTFGLTEGEAVRLCLLSAGVWWALFATIPLRRLRDRPPVAVVASEDERGSLGVAMGAFRQLVGTIRALRKYPQTLWFLLAYLCFNDGIQAAIAFSATYGSKELDLEDETLIQAILLVQLVAFFGALLLGRIARTRGAKRTILGSLVVWTVVVLYAVVIPPGAVLAFFILAAAIGIVLGGSQALSRSLFSQFIPLGREAEYFGLYEISDRATSFVGSLMITLTLQITGSYRLAILGLVVFFIVGFVLLARVDVRRGIHEAGNVVPAVV